MIAPYARALAYIYATKSKKKFGNYIQELWPNVKGITQEEAVNCLRKIGVIPASLFTDKPTPQDISVFISYYNFGSLDKNWNEVRELAGDADLRLTLDAMIVAKYSKQDIYDSIPAANSVVDAYIENFFNIEHLKKRHIIEYMNRLSHEYHFGVLKEALNPSSKEYLDFMLGLKTNRLSEEKVVEEIYRGLFMAFKTHLLKGDADQAAKLARVAISAAKTSKDLKSSSASATDELLGILDGLSFAENKSSDLIIDKKNIDNGDKIE